MSQSMNAMVTDRTVNQVLTQPMTLEPIQNHTQFLQLNELRLFYQAQNDNNIYHVTCKMLQDYLQGSENSFSWDENYDYEFFFQSSNDSNDSATTYHVTCKLLSHPLIVKLLNKGIYGMDFDVNDLKHRYLLTLQQKLNLEQSLKQVLPLYLSQHPIPDSEARLNSNEDLNSSYENIEKDIMATQPYSMIDNQYGFDNSDENIHVSHVAS